MNSEFKNPLMGVPNVESPFFMKIFSDPSFDESTRKIAADLNENGFAVFDFPDPDFDAKAEAIKASLNGKFTWDYWRDHGYEKGEGMRILDAWRFDRNVKNLAGNDEIIALLSKLYGRQARPFQTLNFPVSTQQHYHTDSIHFSSVPERYMCGVWVALEDIDDDAGPLVYYPGSHKWPIYTNEHMNICSAESEVRFTQEVYEPMWRELVEAHGAKPKTFTAKKGQCLIWLANLLHGGLKQENKNKTRWSQVTHYYFDGCTYYTPMHSDPIYGSIAFNTPTDILNRKRFRNEYSGYEVPSSVIRTAKNRPRKDVGAPLPPDFDKKLYLLANKDLADARVDPEWHYKYYGHKEGRPLRP